MSEAQIKGSALADSLRYIERGGAAQVERIVALLDERFQPTYRSHIIASDWYSLDGYSRFLELVLRELEHGDESALMHRAERIVERQLTGIYRIFVRLGSPEWVIKRISAVHHTYFKGIGIAVDSSRAAGDGRPGSSDGRATVRYTGFAPQHRIMQPIVLGFYKKALEISGAKGIRLSFAVPIGAAPTAELVVTWQRS